MMIDPVCGMEVSGSDYSTKHQNVLYAFCSDLCKQSFLQHADTYIDMQLSRIQERNKELELIRSETIQCLSRAAEYKDNETGGHISRMASYCKRLAMVSGLDMRHAQLIEMASPMHDIGKIGIPEYILLKEGPLDANERRIMQQHPEIGADIIGRNLQSELMNMACSISLTHHEKWDGTGYPKGLNGNSIPIEGRIVGLCDVFDALISKRPYKPVWPIDKIKNYISEQTGKHFDPTLAALFLDNFSDYLAICRCCNEE
ncbi:HD domain-containing phosphohydrolase [Mariprofundus ferrooxydans]|uniref:Response regulator n=1 Tax=Mariprofundus ferrooxydans PV-1 TaxID=314345 RepID=Q0F1L7_9PROT|nr:HD domain-containing phosphohydrolase [Mariprofundus ferrooxydans]EAU55174.1 response regulator [Mariprofundus ferrooxydans PV-1]